MRMHRASRAPRPAEHRTNSILKSRAAHVKNAREQNIGWAKSGYTDNNWAEPLDLPFARHWTPVPRCREIPLALIVDQREALSFRVFEGESQSSVMLEDLAVAHPCLGKMARPPFQRLQAVHAQARPNNAARTSALSGSTPPEEREVCARAAFRIRVEKMISAYVVLIHRPLDQPHAERLGVEAVVLSNCG